MEVRLKPIYILAAVIALQSGVFAADPAKPDCVCGDACKCAPGVCPGGCPVASVKGEAPGHYERRCSNGKCYTVWVPDLVASPKAAPVKALTYDEVYAKVAKGEKVTLCVGVPAIAGAGHVETIKGWSPGVYECFKDAAGAHKMQLRSAFASGGNPFLIQSCANGNCPKR